jgi:heme exporter protein B
MKLLSEIRTLVMKDVKTELRQLYALNGLLLHVVSSVFITQLAVKVVDPPTWNALFWIIILFAASSAVAKAYIQESKGRLLYYYSIASPQGIILSKIIYNSLLMLLLSFLCLGVYCLLLGSVVDNMAAFVVCLLLGSLGFASTFTMMSAIASKANSSHVLMPVLSFPVIIPFLLVLIKTAKKSMDGLDPSLIYGDMLVLFALNVISLALAYVLFPFLWRD